MRAEGVSGQQRSTVRIQANGPCTETVERDEVNTESYFHFRVSELVGEVEASVPRIEAPFCPR